MDDPRMLHGRDKRGPPRGGPDKQVNPFLACKGEHDSPLLMSR